MLDEHDAFHSRSSLCFIVCEHLDHLSAERLEREGKLRQVLLT